MEYFYADVPKDLIIILENVARALISSFFIASW